MQCLKMEYTGVSRKCNALSCENHAFRFFLSRDPGIRIIHELKLSLRVILQLSVKDISVRICRIISSRAVERSKESVSMFDRNCKAFLAA